MLLPDRPLSIKWNTRTHNERCRDHCAAVDNQRGERKERAEQQRQERHTKGAIDGSLVVEEEREMGTK
jgi:hypothetical protein